MRRIVATLFACTCAGLLCTSTRAQPTVTVKEVLSQARATENKIQTGSLILLETTKHNRQTEEDIRKTAGATNSSVKGALQIESETPPETKGKRAALFDNGRNALRVEYSNDHQATLLRVYLDDKVTKSYQQDKNVTDPRYPYIPTYRAAGPMPRWNDYNLLLVSRFWRNLDTTKAQVRRGKDDVLIVDLPPRLGSKQFVELNPNQGYAITRVTSIDLKHHRTRFEVRATRTLRDGIWYPATLTQIQYEVNAPTDKKVIDTTVTQVQSAALNVPVSESDLAFGDIPPDTHVTDERFDHPLDYNQGTKQFTDGELKNLSANPDKMLRAAAQTSVDYVSAQQERASGQSTRAGLVVLVGLASGAFLILAGRRVLRQSGRI